MTPEWKWIKDYISLKEANSGDLVLPLRPGNADPTDKECESESLMVVCKSIRIGGGITAMLYDNQKKEMRPCYDCDLKFWKVEKRFSTPLDMARKKEEK